MSIQNSKINIDALVEAVELRGTSVASVRRKSYRDIEGDVRGFSLTIEGGRTVDILMPDHPLGEVRMPEGRHEGDAWNYHKIKVDESWWL